jgi:hypothetical protein
MKEKEVNAAALKRKTDAFEQRRAYLKEEQNREMKYKDEILAANEYRAEQKRRILENEKTSKVKIEVAKRAKSEAVHTLRKYIAESRPLALHKMTVSLQPAGLPPPDMSPGPGEYDPTPQTIRGGYMASSRRPDPINTNPSPFDYEINTSPPSRGVKVRGRGKTDLDWTIALASTLPGVGEYNLTPIDTRASASMPAASPAGGRAKSASKLVRGASQNLGAHPSSHPSGSGLHDGFATIRQSILLTLEKDPILQKPSKGQILDEDFDPVVAAKAAAALWTRGN